MSCWADGAGTSTIVVDRATVAAATTSNIVHTLGALTLGGQTLTVALDLTPFGGYNGVDNFGTVTWKTNGVAMGSFTYANPRSWGSLLVSQGSGNTGTISALTLAQSRMDIAVKANNTNDLDETTSWVLGSRPGLDHQRDHAAVDGDHPGRADARSPSRAGFDLALRSGRGVPVQRSRGEGRTGR